MIKKHVEWKRNFLDYNVKQYHYNINTIEFRLEIHISVQTGYDQVILS